MVTAVGQPNRSNGSRDASVPWPLLDPAISWWNPCDPRGVVAVCGGALPTTVGGPVEREERCGRGSGRLVVWVEDTFSGSAVTGLNPDRTISWARTVCVGVVTSAFALVAAFGWWIAELKLSGYLCGDPDGCTSPGV